MGVIELIFDQFFDLNFFCRSYDPLAISLLILVGYQLSMPPYSVVKVLLQFLGVVSFWILIIVFDNKMCKTESDEIKWIFILFCSVFLHIFFYLCKWLERLSEVKKEG